MKQRQPLYNSKWDSSASVFGFQQIPYAAFLRASLMKQWKANDSLRSAARPNMLIATQFQWHSVCVCVLLAGATLLLVRAEHHRAVDDTIVSKTLCSARQLWCAVPETRRLKMNIWKQSAFPFPSPVCSHSVPVARVASVVLTCYITCRLSGVMQPKKSCTWTSLYIFQTFQSWADFDSIHLWRNPKTIAQSIINNLIVSKWTQIINLYYCQRKEYFHCSKFYLFFLFGQQPLPTVLNLAV